MGCPQVCLLCNTLFTCFIVSTLLSPLSTSRAVLFSRLSPLSTSLIVLFSRLNSLALPCLSSLHPDTPCLSSPSVLLYVFDRFSPYSYQNNKEKYKDDDEKREFTFKECLWFCMTSLTPQVLTHKGGGAAGGRMEALKYQQFSRSIGSCNFPCLIFFYSISTSYSLLSFLCI